MIETRVHRPLSLSSLHLLVAERLVAFAAKTTSMGALFPCGLRAESIYNRVTLFESEIGENRRGNLSTINDLRNESDGDVARRLSSR